MADLVSLKKRNTERWLAMTIKPQFSSQIQKVVQRLSEPSAMARYISVSIRTGVPKEVIAVIHEREAGQLWGLSLAQGDPWNRISTHVPTGRGPFISWEEAAYDALTNCPPYAAKWNDWSAGGTLTLLEQYNGLGYANMGVPSPYIWASTNQYSSGKYVADHVYDPDTVDQQLGCAALLKQMGYLGADLQKPQAPVSNQPIQQEAKPKTTFNFVQTVIQFLISLFGRK